jgi:hypothetical protein
MGRMRIFLPSILFEQLIIAGCSDPESCEDFVSGILRIAAPRTYHSYSRTLLSLKPIQLLPSLRMIGINIAIADLLVKCKRFVGTRYKQQKSKIE